MLRALNETSRSTGELTVNQFGMTVKLITWVQYMGCAFPLSGSNIPGAACSSCCGWTLLAVGAWIMWLQPEQQDITTMKLAWNIRPFQHDSRPGTDTLSM